VPHHEPPPEKGRRGWKLEDIDWSGIQRDMVRDDDDLFYLLAPASFVEILSDHYTRNLIDHYRGDSAVVGWLEDNWRREEMQHGEALKTYVRAVWPEFDWDGAYAGFAAEYGAACTMAALEPSPALEMAARCVVEIGTSTLYRCLFNYVREPVLRQLLANIKADEVRHYGHFHAFFEAYNREERKGFWEVWRILRGRMTEIRDDDSYIAFKHVYAWRRPGAASGEGMWTQYSRYSWRISGLARRNYPYAMAADMLLALLPLPAFLKPLLRLPIVGIARLTLFRPPPSVPVPPRLSSTG